MNTEEIPSQSGTWKRLLHVRRFITSDEGWDANEHHLQLSIVSPDRSATAGHGHASLLVSGEPAKGSQQRGGEQQEKFSLRASYQLVREVREEMSRARD